MRKKNLILIIVIIAIIGIILGITELKKSDKWTEEEAQCISKKSVLYVKTTCGHCSQQEDLLGDCKELFDIINCAIEPKKCIEQGITGVPTWIINGEKYKGVQSLEKLKRITRC